MYGETDRAGRGRAARTLRVFLSFMFPDVCVACGRPLTPFEDHACDACWEVVRASAWPLGKLAVAACGLQVHRFLPFEGPARTLLHALKYEARTSIAREFASIILPAARAVTRDRVDTVVPVPMHRVRRRERGFNQAELIARHLAMGLDIPFLPGLTRTRATASQTGLARRDRMTGVRSAFAPELELEGRRILLIDDIVTTGATLRAAAVAALRGGAAEVTAAAVAESAPPSRAP